MEYDKGTANGNAGEYFVAYTITKLFGWPCRIYGIDIGVDGEVEIVDADRRSAGDIIKIQVKAFDVEAICDTVSVYVDDNHIDYWKRFCVPVVICAVDLRRETVLWRQITSTEAYRSKGSSRKVTFSRSENLLSAASKESWRALIAPPESKRIGELFAELETLDQALPDNTTDPADIDTVVEWNERCEKVLAMIAKIESLISHYPWRVSSMDLSKLDDIRNQARNLKNRCAYFGNVFVNGM